MNVRGIYTIYIAVIFLSSSIATAKNDSGNGNNGVIYGDTLTADGNANLISNMAKAKIIFNALYNGRKTYSNGSSYDISVDIHNREYCVFVGEEKGCSKLYVIEAYNTTEESPNRVKFHTYPYFNSSCKHSFNGRYSNGIYSIEGSFSNPSCADTSNGSWSVSVTESGGALPLPVVINDIVFDTPDNKCQGLSDLTCDSYSDVNTLFNMAEKKYSESFFNGEPIYASSDGFWDKYYPSINAHLKSKDRKVYGYGDFFGGITELGDLDGLLNQLKVKNSEKLDVTPLDQKDYEFTVNGDNYGVGGCVPVSYTMMFDYMIRSKNYLPISVKDTIEYLLNIYAKDGVLLPYDPKNGNTLITVGADKFVDNLLYGDLSFNNCGRLSGFEVGIERENVSGWTYDKFMTKVSYKISEKKPIVISTLLFKKDLFSRKNYTFFGGHAMLITGYDLEKKELYINDTWKNEKGSTWKHVEDELSDYNYYVGGVEDLLRNHPDKINRELLFKNGEMIMVMSVVEAAFSTATSVMAPSNPNASYECSLAQ